ncbi:uncharacterized protein [Anolis sagrei]|uniref:uncharacterized protein n=1 Tax=Anolis sagrei TaxID=38937 RepID=UPI0035214D0B
MQQEEDPTEGGEPASPFENAEEELERVNALASSTAYARPNGVTQRRVKGAEAATRESSGLEFPSPQRLDFLEEKMASMETTLAMMSKVMERLAPLLEEQPPRGESVRSAGERSDRGLGARPKAQTSWRAAAESDEEEERPRGLAPQQTFLVPPAGAGRGTGRQELPPEQRGLQGGPPRAEDRGRQLLPYQPRREELRIEFGGEAGNLAYFLTMVRGYLEDNALTFGSEASRVRAVGAALRGGAAEWYVQLHARHDPCLGSTRRFLAAMEARFRDPLERVRARERLQTITQGHRSVSEYVEEFRLRAEKVPEWSNTTKVQIFKEGLRKEILTWALHRDDPEEIGGWIELAGRIETTLAQVKRHQGAAPQQTRAKEESRGTERSTVGKAPARGPKEQRGPCYVCGRLGHRAAECRQRKGGESHFPRFKPAAGKRAEESPPSRAPVGDLEEEEVEGDIMSGLGFLALEVGAQNRIPDMEN